MLIDETVDQTRLRGANVPTSYGIPVRGTQSGCASLPLLLSASSTDPPPNPMGRLLWM